MIKRLEPSGAQQLLNKARPGVVEVLDVRQAWEYSEMHLPGARLIPLGDLLDRLGELDPDRPVLVYCRTGARSNAAGKFLDGQGFSEVINLDGGLMGWQGVVAEGDADSGMIHFPDIEEIADIYRFGYGMERSLEGFYTALAGKAPAGESERLFRMLAGFEGKHVRQLYALYAQVAEEPLSREAFDALAQSEFAEGGLDPESYVSDREQLFSDPLEAFELAMSIEAQALDFYMRCSRRSGSGPGAETFRRLAREEQGHLRMLTELFDRMA
ncbi:MAG: rhodanese-like domain-containing protein [Desulfovibrio sp.]